MVNDAQSAEANAVPSADSDKAIAASNDAASARLSLMPVPPAAPTVSSVAANVAQTALNAAAIAEPIA